jgi:1,5-anhydro-D-fructose reductase (1,5-anhydro-D-mannitol-forming)
MAFGWGIISTGRHPNRKMAPAINAAKGAKLLAAYSRDIKRAEDFARRHGAEAAYNSLDAFLAHPGLELVYIASPNSLHYQHVIRAAGAGKHVLCEKPMALTEEGAKEMIDTCANQNVHLGVGFHLRHHPGVLEARRLIQSGALGTVILAQAQWASGTPGIVTPPTRTGLEEWWDKPNMVGAGAMMATGVHLVDLLLFLLGQNVVEVSAVTDGHSEANQLERLGELMLRFDQGALATVSFSRRIPFSQNDLVVYGSKARLVLRGALDVVLKGSLEFTTESKSTVKEYKPDEIALYVGLVEAFQESIKKPSQLNGSGWDGLKVVQITSAYNQAATNGSSVSIIIV